MLTSKGMAGVPGSAFLALSATASALGVIPAGAVALLLGVDRIMDSMRVTTNLLGNCVAVFAVSRWEGALDRVTAKKVLNGEPPVAAQTGLPREQARAAGTTTADAATTDPATADPATADPATSRETFPGPGTAASATTRDT